LSFASAREDLGVARCHVTDTELLALDCSIESSLREVLCLHGQGFVEQEVRATPHMAQNASSPEFL
jgi:hypothetical protein